MIIKLVPASARNEACDLIWRTFMTFIAPGWSQEGIDFFRKTIDEEAVDASKDYWGAYEGDTLCGVLGASEGRSHICGFFVDAAYQRRGVGRALWNHLLLESTHDSISVNASDYALPIYEKLGFVATDGRQNVEGMLFTPMRFERKA